MNTHVPVNSVEFVAMPGFRHLQVGDIVQLDGGPHIVVRVNGSGACAEPVSKKHRAGKTRFGKEFSIAEAGKVAHISGNLPVNLVLYRAGDPARDEFLSGVAKMNQQDKDMNSSLVTLEPGDALCYRNEVCTVVSVDDHHAVIGANDGREWREPRRVNEIFFDFKECGKDSCTIHQRFDAVQRAAWLQTFLKARKTPAPVEVQQQNPSVEESEEDIMARKSKKSIETAGEAKEVKTNKPSKSTEAAAPAVKKSGVAELFGYSVTAVCKKLGQAGCSVARAKAIMVARGVDANPNTVSTGVSDGKSEKYNKGTAELTKDQLKELLDAAAEPTAEPKAEKVVKTKGSKKKAAATGAETSSEESASAQ